MFWGVGARTIIRRSRNLKTLFLWKPEADRNISRSRDLALASVLDPAFQSLSYKLLLLDRFRTPPSSLLPLKMIETEAKATFLVVSGPSKLFFVRAKAGAKF